MINKPVCICVSGLGGLTAMRELKKLLPDESIIYFGDTGRMPYGGRPREAIRLIARQNIAFAGSQGVKAILAACGTISSNAQDIIAESPVMTVGVLLPGVKELCAKGFKRLAVIATKTSIESGAFEREIRHILPDAEVMSVPCPEFVPMIEAGHIGKQDPGVADTVARALAPIKKAGCEAVLLGCTHYGIIAEAIAEYLPDAHLTGAADAAARELAAYLRENGMLSEKKGRDICFTSGSVGDFEKLSPIMLGAQSDTEVRFVPPMALEG